ncbi:uncharacterized protein MELLADRAFT_106515 [Melampsora larici-populina 98AG31]|uniref:Uncharacterized protein n=1 Tax=Melampsora larici-populina (strain 98AG31 / pathotype 3-4-7) TaxID=747676 RepID=F4RLR6_MELLP|nr:uncharacterized protein MELLADRAFT_106515 [Melampsora larici-populina 98AG31]EGG06707.1 hypothetical protein MELLADRAFT_106515 [Melampsora larici-populina 98AG31]
MLPSNTIRSYVCLCSRCSKLTHVFNGIQVPGLQVSPVVHQSHQLNDQRLRILESLDNFLDDSVSDKSGLSNPSTEENDSNSLLGTQPDLREPLESSPTSRMGVQLEIQTDDVLDPDLEITTFDPSHFMQHTLNGENPSVIHACLIASCMSIFDHTSLYNSSWLLQAQRNSLEIHIKSSESSLEGLLQPLDYTSQLALQRLPKKIQTVMRWLNIEPSLDYYTCCPDCFALYPLEHTSPVCSHLDDQVPGSLDLLYQNNQPELSIKTTGPPQHGSKRRIRKHSSHGTREEPGEEIGVSMANAQLGEDTSSGDDQFDPLDNQFYGEMEITFVKSFCRMGNLAALLRDETKLPESLRPYASQLHSIFEPQDFQPKSSDIYNSQPLDDDVLDQLVLRLNATQANDWQWKSSSTWCRMSAEDRIKYSPVSSQAHFKTGVKHNNVHYQTHKKSPKNTVVHVVSQTNGATLFGKITKIFSHRRIPGHENSPVDETWLLVRYYKPLSAGMPNPFSRVGEPDLQAHLRLENWSRPYLTRLSEVVASCAWIIYEKGEIHYLLDKKSIALVSLHR